MVDYESDKARYWRTCDVWAKSEVQFLLNGRWPDRDREPPSSLSIVLIEITSEITHDLGDGNFLVEPETKRQQFNPIPDGVSLEEMIEDAVAVGKLTRIEGRRRAWHKFDLEDRFRPAEVIAWARSRGCFPDFPFGEADPDSDTSFHSLQTVSLADNPSEVPAQPLQRGLAQRTKILEVLRGAGYDPMALPVPAAGKAGAKAAARRALASDPLFTGSKVFEKAWGHLRGSGEIAGGC